MPTAIVTHASIGLGPSLTLALAERGWRLVVDDQEPRTLEAQAAGLATATEVIALPGSLVDADHREELVAAAGPSLDLLVNNAAPQDGDAWASVIGCPVDALEDVYRETVLGPLALIQLVLPMLTTDGRIVTVFPRSVTGLDHGDARESAVAALRQLTSAIAAAHAHLQIDAVAPAPALTSPSVLHEILGEEAVT